MAYPSHPGWKAPGPSSDAARAIAGHARTLRNRVHSFLRDRHPAAYSADQIADALGETVLSIRPRVSELKTAGVIEAADGRGKNASGMSAHLWRVVVQDRGEAA